MPHDDVTVQVGAKVMFRTAKTFHDITTVPTKEAYDGCDVSENTAWTNTDGEVQIDGSGTTEEDGLGFYTFTYTATVSALVVCGAR